MRVEAITVNGFGCLPAGRWELPSNGAVLVLADNEAGKSTFAAALLAGICGLPSRRRQQDPLKLIELYRPWDRDDYSIELDLEAAGMRLTVLRDFDRGVFSVRDRDTGKDVTAEFDRDLSRSVLGISRDDLVRIAFVSGKQVTEFGSSPDLRARLSALVEGSPDGSGAEVAIAALESVKLVLDGSEIKVDTALRRLSDGIEAQRRLIRELDSRIDEAGEQAAALDAARAEHAFLRARAAELEAECAVSRLRDTRERIAQMEETRRQLEALRAELQELEPYASFPLEHGEKLRNTVERLRERTRLTEEAGRKLDRARAEQADARRRVEARPDFASATDQDLAELTGCRRLLEDNRSALRVREAEARSALAAAGFDADGAGIEERLGQAERHLERRAAAGWAFATAGFAAAAACLALAALGQLAPLPGALGAALGAAAGLAGLAGRAGAARIVRRLRDMSAQLTVADDAVRSAVERASRLMDSFGMRCSDGQDIERALASVVESLSRHIDDRRALRELDREVASLSRELDDRARGQEDDRTLVSSILVEAGIDPGLPLEDSLERFAEGEARCRRYRDVRDTRLPEMAARAASDEDLDRLRAEEARLAAGCPDPDRPARSFTESESELRRIRERLDSAQENVWRLERAVGELVDRYRREYPAAQERLGELEADQSRVERFGRATGTAAEVLREVARTSYRRWAAALNEQASSILSRLNPAYEDLRFDDSLGFTVRRAGDGRVLEQAEIDAFLSTGAKDQIYLAVRLACCLELSKSPEAIPIILDDPLVAADDGRFRRGMRFLVEEMPRSNQVIVLSCHASRHNSLRGDAWFHENVAVLELQ